MMTTIIVSGFSGADTQVIGLAVTKACSEIAAQTMSSKLLHTVYCILLTVTTGIFGEQSAVNPVRIGEFKFVCSVKLHGQFKCLAILVSHTHVLSPCDCVGQFSDQYLFKYYFPHHLKIIAGAVQEQDDTDNTADAQTRTPYVMQKHPQCIPYEKQKPKPIQWLMYNYGLMKVSFPFLSDYRVAPISFTNEITIRSLITDLIKTQGECKTVSFPKDPTNASFISTHLEWSHVQLIPTDECIEELCPMNTSDCIYDDYYFFGKFCATERFVKARDACFNNSGAPVICGGTYMGHLGDNIACPQSQEGRFFMYARFDWAIPFVHQSSVANLKVSVATLLCIVYSFVNTYVLPNRYTIA